MLEGHALGVVLIELRLCRLGPGGTSGRRGLPAGAGLESDQEAMKLAPELFGEDPVLVSVEVWLGSRRIARLAADGPS